MAEGVPVETKKQLADWFAANGESALSAGTIVISFGCMCMFLPVLRIIIIIIIVFVLYFSFG